MEALASLVASLVTPLGVALWLVGANFAAFAAFGIDKALAEANARRISEATLLQLAFLGGTPGAYAGRRLFRHKTRKQRFSNHLHTIAILQLAGLAGVAIYAAP